MNETLAELIQELTDLHVSTLSTSGKKICETCALLCHSHSGLYCDDTDGEWPCDTMRIVLRYKEENG